MNKLGKTIGGTQSVVRALELLRLLAKGHEAGVDLPTLVAQTGLERTTVYRLVSALAGSGFAERGAGKRYRLGIESMQLGLAAMSRAPVLDSWRPVMQAIARQTEDTVYLVVRNGDYGHCLHREEGIFPIKTFTVIVGSLRLLGLGTAGQALLATLGTEEVNALYRRHSTEYDLQGMSRLKLLETVQRTRRNGHSETESLITPGVGAVGAAFAVTSGSCVAISVAAIKQRMDAERRNWIAGVLSREVEKLGFKNFQFETALKKPGLRHPPSP